MTIKVYSHNPYSEGSRSLSAQLGLKRIRHIGSRWTPKRGDKVINWGSSNLPDFGPAQIINIPDAVRVCANKLRFFETVPADCCVPWTTDRQVTLRWLQEGREAKVVCRTLLTGHSGNGIIIAESDNELVNAPLYTKYVKKQAEYRVHLIRSRNGEIRTIDIQRKIRDPEREPTDWNVRSHANGFMFVRNDVVLPANALDNCIRAFEAVGLDFGAVDVLWNQREQRAYVLEINTAPGLTGTTVENYATAFREAFF